MTDQTELERLKAEMDAAREAARKAREAAWEADAAVQAAWAARKAAWERAGVQQTTSLSTKESDDAND